MAINDALLGELYLSAEAVNNNEGTLESPVDREKALYTIRERQGRPVYTSVGEYRLISGTAHVDESS